jgi:hypothetical protein
MTCTREFREASEDGTKCVDSRDVKNQQCKE